MPVMYWASPTRLSDCFSNWRRRLKWKRTYQRDKHNLARHFLDFVGYVEGRDIFMGNLLRLLFGRGFVGNGVLSSLRALAEALHDVVSERSKKMVFQLGYLFVRGAFNRFKITSTS